MEDGKGTSEGFDEPLLDFDLPQERLKDESEFEAIKQSSKCRQICGCNCLGKTSHERALRGGTVCIMILMVLSVVVPLVLTVLKNSGIADEVVIDSFSSPNFDIWQSNYYGTGKKREVLCNLHLFSVQNPILALQGEKPIMLEQGPYVFHQYFNKYDIEFLDGGNIVQYRLQNFYIYDPALSGPGLSLDDKVILPYPTALGFQYLLDMIPVEAEVLLDAALEEAINSRLDAILEVLQTREDAINANPFLSEEKRNSSLAILDELMEYVHTIENGVDGYIEDAPTGSSLLKIILCTALPNSTG